MHEENPDDASTNRENIIDAAVKKAMSSGENNVHNEGMDKDIICEDDLNDTGADGDEDDVADRRKYPRSEFTYPVEFRVFSRNSDNASFKSPDQAAFNGYLKDISLSGAGLQFEDRYGRFDVNGMNNVKLKLSFRIPEGDKTNIFAEIRWIKKAGPKNFSIKMGIEFKDVTGWQSDAIEKLIGMRNKDHNMMWNLWEQYEEAGGKR